jgi:hypothetical protein
MNRWLMIGTLVGMLGMTTGCLHHNTRGGCQSCGHCNTGKSSGLLGKLGGKLGGHQGACGHAGGRHGCVAGPLGWQQGGHNYSSYLQPGVLGHRARGQVQGQPFTPGPPTGQVGYPYYTHKGPRDFLLDDPPSIGR